MRHGESRDAQALEDDWIQYGEHGCPEVSIPPSDGEAKPVAPAGTFRARPAESPDMSTTTSASLTAADLTIVDVDSHVDESVEDLLPFVESSGVRRTVENANVRREIFTEVRPTPPFPTTNSLVNKDEVTEPSIEHSRGVAPDAKKEYMQTYDIDHAVLSPGQFGLAGVNHDLIAVELARAYNRFVSTEYLPEFDADRVKANILVAPQRPQEAAAIVDEWGVDDRFGGVQLPTAGLVPPAGHHWYDPIYEAAERHGLPVVMHVGSATGILGFPIQQRWAQTFTETHQLLFPIEAMWHFNSLMFRGAPERFPGVDWVVVEAGVEWVPWMTWRMDDHYLQNAQDVPILERRPSEYIEESFYFTTMPLGHTQASHHQSSMIEAAGADSTVLFASDHPHADLDMPDEFLSVTRNNLDEEAVRSVMGETAGSLFGF